VNLAEVVGFDFDPGDGLTAYARLGGDLDIVSVQAIGDELIGYAAAGSLVVDITDVDFLDSSGLKLLVDCAKTVRSRGGHFAVVCPEGAFRSPEPRRRRGHSTAHVNLDRAAPTRCWNGSPFL